METKTCFIIYIYINIMIGIRSKILRDCICIYMYVYTLCFTEYFSLNKNRRGICFSIYIYNKCVFINN